MATSALAPALARLLSSRALRISRGLVLFGTMTLVLVGDTIGSSRFGSTKVVSARSDTLVIQEFRTRGPNGGFDEFVEIQNVSGAAINLNGWRLEGSNANGVEETRATLNNVTLGPGCSWLLANSNEQNYSGPTADQPYAIGISDDGGIALRRPDGVIADAVGLSSRSAFGEGARLSPLTTNRNRSYERTRDDDNNASDFAGREPSTPRAAGDGCVGSSPTPTPTDPGIQAFASPSTVDAGEAVLVSGRVTPGTNPGSSDVSVTANLSTIGGAAATSLLDDGTSGDEQAGDLTFSRRVVVAPQTTGGVKSLALQVRDGQNRSAAANLSLNVRVLVPSTPPTAMGVVRPDPLSVGASARVEAIVTPGSNPVSTGLDVVLDLEPLGGSRTVSLSDAGGGACDLVAGDLTFSTCVVIPSTTALGPRTLSGRVSDQQSRTSSFTVGTSVVQPSDTDADGLSDNCELAFGLNRTSAPGDGEAAGDADNDGRPNQQECQAFTHPRGFHQRFLAEGVTNEFFRTQIALLNPSSTEARALIRIQPQDLPERQLVVTVPAASRRTITPPDTAGLTGAPFATVVESDVELVVDRLMTWGVDDYGSHAETAVHAPSTTWYLAEGATGWQFSLFYLLQNPTDQMATVEVSYLRGRNDEVLRRTYVVLPRRRYTIPVDDEQFPQGSGIKPLAETDVSARIVSTNGVPIIVERAMYLSAEDQPFAAGHAGAGVTQPETNWFFAEGSTGGFFDEYLLFANPGAVPADVTVTFSPERRPVIVKTYRVAPNSRLTVWVDQIPELAATPLSATVTATAPIVAERAMWWPGTGVSWRESHVSAGATESGPRWGIADLEVGGPHNASSYVLIYNGGTLTLYFDDGTAPRVCRAAGPGRVTIDIGGCPGAAGKRFVSAVVDGHADTVVERATYYSQPGQIFSAGVAALAARIP